jgi:hypothetical protein
LLVLSLASRDFSGFLGFPPSVKINISKFQLDLIIPAYAGTAERILDWGANLWVSTGLVFVSPKFSHREFRLKSNGVDCRAGFRWLRELAFLKLTFVYVIF